MKSFLNFIKFLTTMPGFVIWFTWYWVDRYFNKMKPEQKVCVCHCHSGEVGVAFNKLTHKCCSREDERRFIKTYGYRH